MNSGWVHANVVEEKMWCSEGDPFVKHIIEYKNGNSLSYADNGDREGYPILVQHGMIASFREY